MGKRANGEGSIFQQKRKRKDGTEYIRWCAEIYISGGDQHHTRKVKRIYGDSQKEVSELKKKELAAQQKGLLVDTNNITLKNYIPHWLELKKTSVKSKTYESYVYTCDQYIKPGIGHMKIQNIKVTHLDSFFGQQLANGLKSTSVIRMKTIISNILNQAVRENIIAVNVSSICNTIKKDTKEINVLSPEQIKVVLDKAKELYQAKGVKFNFLYHAVLLALATGMRKGEILALSKNNIDFKKNTISIKYNLVELNNGLVIESPKTKASIRTIAVASNVMNELQEFITKNESKQKEAKSKTEDEEKETDEEATSETNLIFHTSSNKPISPSNLGRAFRNLLNRNDVNIKGIRFHDLRHTHATTLISNGVNIKQVSVRLGHEDVRITLQTYTHFLPEQDRESAEIIGNILM